MATRGMYHFKQGKDTYTIYNHWDNYPSGAYELIEKALKLAWPLPRFEADEFAAAFIAANKRDAGGMRLLPNNKPIPDMGQDYDYYISHTCENSFYFNEGGDLIIEFEDYDGDKKIKFKGTLAEMKAYIDKQDNDE